MVLVAPRSAKLVETRGARFTLLCGYVSLLLAFATMLLLWKEGIPYWKVGLAYAFIGIGVGLRRHARLALADRLGARAARRHGVRHRRPPARPRRRDHAVDLRRAADRRLRGGGGRGDRRRAEQRAGQRRASRTSSRSPSPAPRPSRSSTRSTRARSPPRPSSRSSTATSGRTRRASSPSLLGAVLVCFLLPAQGRGAASCSRATRPRTPASPDASSPSPRPRSPEIRPARRSPALLLRSCC